MQALVILCEIFSCLQLTAEEYSGFFPPFLSITGITCKIVNTRPLGVNQSTVQPMMLMDHSV